MRNTVVKKEITIDGYKYTIDFENGQEIYYNEDGESYTWGQLQRYNYNDLIYNGDGEAL